MRDLAAFLHVARYPLAVRSSSLLEDSQYQPFAGVYATYMIPNNSPSASARLVQLETAVKMVWASTFTRHAKAYLAATPYRLEEEKMAVVLQRVVGTAHGGRFYPSFAGVARSHNFYPSAPMTTADGIAAVALGFGESVVDGDACIRFCPRFPRHMVQFSSVKDIQRNSQRHFFALPVAEAEGEDGALRPVTGVFDLRRYGLDVAERDGTLAAVGSTWSPENDAVYDGITRPGVRLVSFAPILKHGVFPAAGAPRDAPRPLDEGDRRARRDRVRGEPVGPARPADGVRLPPAPPSRPRAGGGGPDDRRSGPRGSPLPEPDGPRQRADRGRDGHRRRRRAPVRPEPEPRRRGRGGSPERATRGRAAFRTSSSASADGVRPTRSSASPSRGSRSPGRA